MPTCCENCFAQQEYYNPRWDETEYSCGITYKKLGFHSRQDWEEWHCARPEWCPLKEIKDIKSLLQKCVNEEHHYKCPILEGIAKDEATAPDIEEAQELIK